VLELVRLGENREPDTVLHDLEAGEVILLWDDERVAAVVEGVGVASVPAATRR
jgi:hypothetical protein